MKDYLDPRNYTVFGSIALALWSIAIGIAFLCLIGLSR